MTLDELKTYIRDIRDFPKPGIVFKDITPLLTSGPAFQEVVDRIASRYRGRADMVLGIESRGFIIGAAVAYRLGVGFVPIRKPGKLPAENFGQDYELEYGADRLEIHRDALQPGERVLLVDDLIATGGTAEAAVKLIGTAGGSIVGCAFVIDLPDLGGRKKLETLGFHVMALCQFAGH